MSINPVTQFPGKVAPATPDNPFGTARNITIPGDGTGTPWESSILKDEWGFQHAMLINAGMEPNGTPDSAENSQLFKAAKASIGNGANLLSNHNFLIASPDDSQPPPDATPRSYPPGFQIFSGVFANETTGITDLTYINGRVSFTAGDFYIPRANSKELENITEFVASVADFDGKPRTRGVSFALVGDEYRVTVGVDALEDVAANPTPLGSVKFEQGSVATGHEVQSWKGQVYSFDSVSDMINIAPVGSTSSVKGDSTYKRLTSISDNISDFEPVWISDNSEDNSGYSVSSSLIVSGPITYDAKLKLKNDGSNSSAQHNFDVLQNILAGMPNGAEILLPKRGYIKCKSGLDVTASGVSFVGGNYGGASFDSTWIEFIDGAVDAINLKNYGFTAFAINFRGASLTRGGDVTQDIFNIEMPSVNFDGVFDLCQFSFARNAFAVKNEAARNLKVINGLFSNMQSAFLYSHLGGVDVRDFEFFSNRYHSMGLSTDANAVFDVVAAANVQNLIVQGGHVDDSNLLMRGFAAGLTLDGVQARRMLKGYAEIDSSGCSLSARIRKADILNTTHIMSDPANGDTSSALKVNGSMIASIDNFDIMGSGGHGLEINNNSLTDVGKMEIHDAGQSADGTYDGIHVSSGAVLAQLSGDVSVHQDRFGTVTNKTRYGINNLGSDTIFSDEIYVDNMVGREYNSNGQRWRGPAPVGFSSKVKYDYGSAQPSSGVWGVGDYRVSTNPSAGSAIEKWVCSVAGDFSPTPPTFRAVRFT